MSGRRSAQAPHHWPSDEVNLADSPVSDAEAIQMTEFAPERDFSERNVTRLLEREPMAAPGAACLARA
jgi:hypothetical protein